ncbi:MAG: hypothetical protein ACT4N4_17270 [Rhodospirillales bacterium]
MAEIEEHAECLLPLLKAPLQRILTKHDSLPVERIVDATISRALSPFDGGSRAQNLNPVI